MPKQIVVTKLGGADVLEYQDYKLPSILKNKDVRIKHTAIGLNYIDTYHRSGIYPVPFDLPFCLGMEAAGEIIEVGNEVSNFIGKISSIVYEFKYFKYFNELL